MQGTFLIIGGMLLAILARVDGPVAVDDIWWQVGSQAGLLALAMVLLRSLLRRHPSAKAANRYQIITQVWLLLLYGWWILGLGWALASPSLLVTTLPLPLFLALQWWLGAGVGPGRIDQHLRWAMLRQRWRFALLLPMLLVACHDLIWLVQVALPWDRIIGPDGHELVAAGMNLALLLGLGLGLGPLLAIAWRAAPVAEPHASALRRLCERAGLRIRRIWQWPSFELPFYNAMAVGLAGPFRSIFISEDLLRHLDDPQRDAVIGHEIGHLRHHHHLIFILLMLCASALATWAGPWIDLLVITPLASGATASTFRLVLIAGYLVFVIRICFGIVSRACERQADLSGAQLAGSPQAMQAALRTVANLSGQALDAPSWRHHSIAARIAFLERVHRDPGLGLWHHWYVRMLRLILIIVLVTAILLQFGSGLGQPDLAALRANDPVLDRAIAQSVNGKTDDLAALIANSESLQRQRIAIAIYREIGTPAEGEDTVDGRAIRPYLPALRLFTRSTTGDKDLQLVIRNAIAYGLVAGSEQPSTEEIAEADSLYADLDAAVEKNDNAQFRDTLGCIDHRMGRYNRAKEQFTAARRLLPAASTVAEEQFFLDLLERRIDAATEQRPALPLEWDDLPTDAPPADDGEQPAAEPAATPEPSPDATPPSAPVEPDAAAPVTGEGSDHG